MSDERRAVDTAALARQIAGLASGRGGVFRGSRWSERLLTWAMADDSFKTQLFRFVDVFPATSDDADVRRHVEEYFSGQGVPRLMRAAVATARHLPPRITASVARRNIERMARQFIVGRDAGETARELERLWLDGRASTVDLLGEKVVTEDEADRYATRVEELIAELVRQSRSWPSRPLLERDDVGPIPRVSVSIKPTALASSYAPLTRADGLAQARGRLLPILKTAAEHSVSVWFDMEHYDVKDLTIELFHSLLDDPALVELDAGLVVQAYLRDSFADLRDLLAWADRRRVGARPVGVRLVKGAYWDAETITARAEGWPVPVYERKADTDANYERCAALLHEHHGVVRAAFGTHNIRSLAFAISEARRSGIPDDAYEVQMLYGMADSLHAAVQRLGIRVRVYAPMGELVPGMAYLVRRLLENTSNESFVRQRFIEGRAVEALLAAPVADLEDEKALAVAGDGEDRSRSRAYEPEPVSEWRRAPARAAMARAVDTVPLGRSVPAVIGGRRVMTGEIITSLDPADPSTTVAVSAACKVTEVEAAMASARAAWPGWRATPPTDRADVLFRAAAWLRARRRRLAALQVFEAGKPWKEADADVCEAIDFCEYYGREMVRLAAGGRVDSPPGESNVLTYDPKGVGVVIAPWNFPLAIPLGMVAAALVTGNAVVLKPAEQTPAIAAAIVDAMEHAGLPPGVLSFLPGVGEEIGPALVTHPETNFVVFTGSKAVGLAINEQAARPWPGQRHVRRVVAEMGGKNALIVDADADLDQAVPAVVHSAFGYSGQKCSAASRVVAVGRVHDQLVERLIGATRVLRIGHPRDMGTQLGPVIDADARARIAAVLARVPEEGEILFRREDVPSHGWYVGPAIVAAPPHAAVAREEVFGPVLNVARASTFEEAVGLANDTEYALTAGVFSRSPRHIALAARELRAGNVYVNRAITGAVVGRQPFGGHGLSGVGSKAGGPDYLLQFVDPRVVTENTLRQGFAPKSP